MGVSLYVNITNIVSVHRPSPDFVYQSCRKGRDMPQQLIGDTIVCKATSVLCHIVRFLVVFLHSPSYMMYIIVSVKTADPVTMLLHYILASL
jgi:hypothetical protein